MLKIKPYSLLFLWKISFTNFSLIFYIFFFFQGYVNEVLSVFSFSFLSLSSDLNRYSPKSYAIQLCPFDCFTVFSFQFFSFSFFFFFGRLESGNVEWNEYFWSPCHTPFNTHTLYHTHLSQNLHTHTHSHTWQDILYSLHSWESKRFSM